MACGLKWDGRQETSDMSRLFYGIKTAENLLSINVQTRLTRFFNFMGIFVGTFSLKPSNSNYINILPKIFYPVGDAK